MNYAILKQELKGKEFYYGVCEGRIFTSPYKSIIKLINSYPELAILFYGGAEAC